MSSVLQFLYKASDMASSTSDLDTAHYIKRASVIGDNTRLFIQWIWKAPGVFFFIFPSQLKGASFIWSHSHVESWRQIRRWKETPDSSAGIPVARQDAEPKMDNQLFIRRSPTCRAHRPLTALTPDWWQVTSLSFPQVREAQQVRVFL